MTPGHSRCGPQRANRKPEPETFLEEPWGQRARPSGGGRRREQWRPRLGLAHARDGRSGRRRTSLQPPRRSAVAVSRPGPGWAVRGDPGLDRPRALSAPRVLDLRRRASRPGPPPRDDGCRTPGPQLLPLPGALLRPRTLLSRAAADGREQTPSSRGGSRGEPRRGAAKAASMVTRGGARRGRVEAAR